MSRETVTQMICDLCNRTQGSTIDKCIVCKRDCCYTCRWSVIFHTHICRECKQNNPAAKEIIERYVTNWRRYTSRMEKELVKVKPVKTKSKAA